MRGTVYILSELVFNQMLLPQDLCITCPTGPRMGKDPPHPRYGTEHPHGNSEKVRKYVETRTGKTVVLKNKKITKVMSQDDFDSTFGSASNVFVSLEDEFKEAEDQGVVSMDIDAGPAEYPIPDIVTEESFDIVYDILNKVKDDEDVRRWGYRIATHLRPVEWIEEMLSDYEMSSHGWAGKMVFSAAFETLKEKATSSDEKSIIFDKVYGWIDPYTHRVIQFGIQAIIAASALGVNWVMNAVFIFIMQNVLQTYSTAHKEVPEGITSKNPQQYGEFLSTQKPSFISHLERLAKTEVPEDIGEFMIKAMMKFSKDSSILL